MQKWSRALTSFFIFLLFTNPIFPHWIESYYSCVCYSENKSECTGKVESEYPDSKGNTLLTISTSESVHLLTQIRAAQIILEQRYLSRPEETACLLPAKTQLAYALSFSIREHSGMSPESRIYIKALHELSREIYQWAEDNCFDQKGTPNESLRSELPNPAFCRKHR